jgi:hypothetical protein
MRNLARLLIPAALPLLACSSASEPGASSGDLPPTAPASATAAPVAPAAATPRRVERLPNGLLKITRGTETGYLRARCDASDRSAQRCHSYVGVDEAGNMLPAGAPGRSCSGGTGVCLGAADLQQAYGIPANPSPNATVGIVGWNDSTTFESDLATYRAAYGLPSCTSASGCFTKVNESGASSPLAPVGGGWAGEMTLDITMASAGCPSCKIVVVEATSDLYTAVATAVRLGASVVSYSGGQSEFSTEATQDSRFAALGVALFASTGDNGGADTTGDIIWPAVSSAFTGVGGTDLSPSAVAVFPDGTPRGWAETAWVQPDTNWGGAGWGCSAFEPKPAWQKDTGCKNRMVGDVAAIAGTGVWIYSTDGGGWGANFGTSVASPLVAAIYAQTGATKAAPGVSYLASPTPSFTDIGTNIAGPGTCPSSDPAYFCNAEAGYDSPTGNGTPIGYRLAARSWKALTATLPLEAIVSGTDSDGSPLYACRAPLGGSLQPGKTRSSWGTCDVGFGGTEEWVAGAEVLVSAWEHAIGGAIPKDAVAYGRDSNGAALYACRAPFGGGLELGKIGAALGGCYIPFGGLENQVTSYDVLVDPDHVGYEQVPLAGQLPAQALRGGTDSNGAPLYTCLGSFQGGVHPGKTRSDWGSCDISWGGAEHFVTPYQVLVPQFSPPPVKAYQAGVDGNGAVLGVCNVPYGSSTQVGKYLSYGACNFGFGGKEISLGSGFNVLTAF